MRIDLISGVWYYRGQAFDTARAALLAAWLDMEQRKRNAAHGAANTGSGGVEKVTETPFSTPNYTANTGVLQA